MRILPLFLFVFASVAGAAACYSETTTATPFTPDAGTDSAAPVITCGQPGSLCTGTEWCEYTLVGSCGREAKTGKCAVRPTLCPKDCPLVCGCDGQRYCNACEAHVAGTDVDKNRDCAASTGEVSAFALYTDPPKIAIFKKDTTRNLCLRVTLVRRLGSLFGLDVPSEWGVEDGTMSNDPTDCSITVTGLPPTPKGVALRPVGGQGRVTFSSDSGQAGKFPCSLDVDARIAFERQPEYAWVPNVEVLSGNTITVNGGCP